MSGDGREDRSSPLVEPEPKRESSPRGGRPGRAPCEPLPRAWNRRETALAIFGSRTSIEVRIMVTESISRGRVRQKLVGLQTSLRWASNAPSRRPRRPSIVSPSSFSSSSGPTSASRSCRFSSEICRVAALIVRSGRRTRPAISQPNPTETTNMMARTRVDRQQERLPANSGAPSRHLHPPLSGRPTKGWQAAGGEGNNPSTSP